MKKKALISLIGSLGTIALFMKVVQAETVISGRFDTADIDKKAYVVQNNVWGAKTPQSLTVDDVTGAFSVTAGHDKSTAGAPASYPSIFKGSHWGNTTNDSGMPKQIGVLGNVNSSWNFTVPGSGAWNCAYDIWVNKTGKMDYKAPDGMELMIWLNRKGPIQPAGIPVASGVSLEGANWNVWYTPTGSLNIVSYYRTATTTSCNLNLKNFIIDAKNRGYCQSSWYLVSVEAGFEIWQEGTGLTSNSFSVTVDNHTVETARPAGASE